MDADELRQRVREFLAVHDPATTERLTFLRERFDAGLAWISFPEGLGGLGAPRALQSIVDGEFAAAGAPDNNPLLSVRQWSPALELQFFFNPETSRVRPFVGVGLTYTFFTDIQPQMLEILRRRLADKKINNVTLVQGAIDDPRLPPASVDLELMVDVYHELSQPQAMLHGLRDALKPGGRLVLLEYRKEDPTIPIKPEHKMSVAEAKLEVEHEGFTLSKVDEALPWQHILIFTKREP